ncbi:protein of unknown function [Pseudomonas mediterranea]
MSGPGLAQAWEQQVHGRDASHSHFRDYPDRIVLAPDPFTPCMLEQCRRGGGRQRAARYGWKMT